MRKLFSLFFHYFYHSLAWSYDIVADLVSIGRWNTWRLACLPYVRGPNVLEIGFGTGHIQVALIKNGYIVFGLDESRQMAMLAKKNIQPQQHQTGLCRGLAQSLPYSPNSMDSVVATFPSDYILQKITLSEIYRVLNSSGRLILVPMAWIDGATIPDRLANWLFHVTGQTSRKNNCPEKYLAPLLNEAGFHMEIIREKAEQSTVLIIIAEKSGR
ncbi:MAG: class I SAM-dependent methyltransferase [Chloroflexota bacterium]